MQATERIENLILPAPNNENVTVGKYYLFGEAHASGDLSNYAVVFARFDDDRFFALSRPPEEVLSHLQTFFGVLTLIAIGDDKYYSPQFRGRVKAMMQGYEEYTALLFEEHPPQITEEYLAKLEPVRQQWSAFMRERAFL